MPAAATWVSVCGTLLGREALANLRLLEDGDGDGLRARLPRLFFSDASTLEPSQVPQWTLNTVAENTLDAMVGPLFWGAVAGIPGVIGYRRQHAGQHRGLPDGAVRAVRHRRCHIGDLVNWIPARLSAVAVVLLAPAVGGSTVRAWRVLMSSVEQHLSPKSWPMFGSFAGALDVTISTPAKPNSPMPLEFGEGPAAGITDARRAVRLSRLVGVAATIAFAWLAARIRKRSSRM